MSDLINREAVCGDCMIEKGGRGCWACLVKDAPTVDAVEVVRCRECKYSAPLEKHCELNPIYKHCSLWRGEETKNVWHKYTKHYRDYSIVEGNDFCSYGERKEESE